MSLIDFSKILQSHKKQSPDKQSDLRRGLSCVEIASCLNDAMEIFRIYALDFRIYF
jgi:hypothetical protein